MLTTLDIVVPCYNEAANLPKLFNCYREFREKHRSEYEVRMIIVDNGSSDGTANLVKTYIDTDSSCTLYVLSRNFGKEASLSAGLIHSTASLVVPIDADLQDPIEVISIMLECWKASGSQVILARRVDRKNDSARRRIYSALYMRAFARVAEIEMPLGVGEFRLMTRQVVDAFSALPESQRFVRGLFAWLGFETEIIEFERKARVHGRSTFSFTRLLNLGINGIVSFSTKPLRLSIGFGICAASVSLILSLVVLFEKFFHRVPVPGYTSLAFLILFLGGIQLFSIGILGEYLGKVLLESKRRPIYIVKEKYGGKSNDNKND
jgi:glycosyltransferase involved in cell wall biosynthesis